VDSWSIQIRMDGMKLINWGLVFPCNLYEITDKG